LEGFVDARIETLEQVERVDELARPVKIRKPKAQDGAVARVAGEAEGDELRLFFRGVSNSQASAGLTQTDIDLV
jgi:hypothetical protein